MPDVVTHYAVGLLLASRVERSWVKTVLLALVALAPDVDAVFRVHRWFTHSLVLATLAFSLVALATLYTRRSLLKYVAVAALLYTLHIVLDLFTASTPILWPITIQAYMLNIDVTGMITQDGVNILPSITISSVASDFTPKAMLEGPVITATGIITSIGVLAAIIIENLYSRK